MPSVEVLLVGGPRNGERWNVRADVCGWPMDAVKIGKWENISSYDLSDSGGYFQAQVRYGFYVLAGAPYMGRRFVMKWDGWLI